MKRPTPPWLAPTQILGLCVILTLALRHGGVAGDPGVGWHIAAGERILQLHEIPRADTFLTPQIDSPWIHTQWLGDLVFALVYRIGGWPMLELMTIAVGWAITLFLLPKMLTRPPFPSDKGVPEPIRMLAVLASMFLLAVQWFLRPVLFSFLLFALLYRMLAGKEEMDANRSGRFDHDFWRIPALFILWVNLHPAFILGLLLLAIRLAADLFARSWNRAKATALLLCMSLCATMINPYGLALHRQMIQLGRSRYFQNLNSEWLSPNYAESIFFPHLVVATLLVLSLISFRRRLGLFESMTSAVFLALSLSGARYLPFLAVPAAFTLSRAACLSLSRRTIERFSRLYTPRTELPLAGAAVAILFLFVMLSGAFPGRTGEDSSIVAATKIDIPALISLCAAHGAERIFASPDLGGALIFYGKNGVRPFIDDRNELNGISRYEQYFKASQGREEWKKALADSGADCVLAGESPLNVLISHDQSWTVAGESGHVTAFVMNR